MKRKSSINKCFYEKNGQISFFGRDNLVFKTVNMPNKQKFINICKNFNLKKPIKKYFLSLTILEKNK
tara:strand:- start:390 stop:590 length:201 start_codon:yes stop_codon:yes gene_type:complete